MTPTAIYRRYLEEGDIRADTAQAVAVEQLQETYDALIDRRERERRPGRRVLRLMARRSDPPPRGIYLWGGVGRGKTWLMDLFFDSLPFAEKERLHFHRFMNRIHQDLAALQGRSDPLDRVALHIAERAKVLCLDELLVIDIGDAMILHQLFKSLVQRGVTLATTSNVRPDDLYKNGLQRTSFLPAIDLLNAHTRVICIGEGVDYRQRFLSQCEVYHTPHNEAIEARMEREFNQLAPHFGVRDVCIRVISRDIPVKRLADDLVWFDFQALCGPPRSQADYIEIARCYHTVLISDVPVMGAGRDHEARRFIFLIDELYDRNVKVILSAARPLDALYTGERLAFEFQRTQSRLQEMQSPEWQGRAHRP